MHARMVYRLECRVQTKQPGVISGMGQVNGMERCTPEGPWRLSIGLSCRTHSKDAQLFDVSAIPSKDNGGAPG